MKKPKTVYYTDELNDDFSPTNGKIRARTVLGDYRYLHGKNPLWHIAAFLMYRVLATPVAFLYTHLLCGMRIRGRRNLRKIKGGYFLYGNHTQLCGDAFTPSMLTFPRKANVLVHPDIVSIPVARRMVPMMGALPIPTDMTAARHLMKALPVFLSHGQAITIFPEAHIWPYYNGIRPFTDTTFGYPFLFHVPAVGFTVTYRQRKILRRLPPLVTVTVGEPIYPEDCRDKTEMRDRIHAFMQKTVEEEKSYAYIQYVKKEKTEHEDHSCM